MFQVPINYALVIACAISDMIIGLIWYGPLFGKKWMGLVGMTEKKMTESKKDMNRAYLASFIASAVTAYVLAHFIWFTAPGSTTLLIGIKTGIWAWLGFVATTSLTSYIWNPDKKPIELYFLDNGYRLVSLLVMGIILSIQIL